MSTAASEIAAVTRVAAPVLEVISTEVPEHREEVDGKGVACWSWSGSSKGEAGGTHRYVMANPVMKNVKHQGSFAIPAPHKPPRSFLCAPSAQRPLPPRPSLRAIVFVFDVSYLCLPAVDPSVSSSVQTLRDWWRLGVGSVEQQLQQK